MQTETGFWMRAITFETLLRQIAQHRANNSLPLVNPPFETLAAEIEDHFCQAMSPEDQTKLCDTGVRHRNNINWKEIQDFITSVGAFFTSGQQQVTQEEADRRSNICATCPLNVSVVGCVACVKAIDAFRDKIAKVRPTNADSLLKACGVCGCDLKTIVHFPLETLRAKGDKDFPDWCWQKRDGSAEVLDAQSENT